MAGLEESIFQKNVPGRFSKWDQDERRDPRDQIHTDEGEVNDNCGDEENEDLALLQYAEKLSKAEVPETIRQRILAERAGGPATGVKGVLADYRAAQAMAAAEAEAEALARQQVITRIVEGAKVVTSAEKTAEEILEEQLEQQLGEDSDGLDDDDDDEFMREFRAKRLQELKGRAAQTGGGSLSLPVFGAVREVRSEQFLAELDGEDPRVVVVVHLYEPAVQGCARMNTILEELAAAMPTIKFLRMQASSNEIEVDRVALPILTLYRAGQEIHTLAGIAADFGQYFTAEEISWLLTTVLPPIDKYPGQSA